MFKIMMTLHLLFAIFAIGPLVHAVTTAIRGVRQGDAAATAASARMARIYAYASVLVVIFGFGLMSSKYPNSDVEVAKFGETWIWLSLVLWVAAMAIVLAVTAPALSSATRQLTAGETLAPAVRARIAGSGGLTGVIFIVIVFLMVYQPGG